MSTPRTRRSGRARSGGFTVVELMIGVLLMAILSVVAIPNFYHYKSRSRRVEAYIGLGTIMRLQDEFFSRRRRYANTIEELGYHMHGGSLVGPNAWKAKVYTFSITPLNWDSTSYLASATGNIDGDAFQDVLVMVK